MFEFLEFCWSYYRQNTGMMWGSLPTMIVFLLSMKFMAHQAFLETGGTQTQDVHDGLRAISRGDLPAFDPNNPIELGLFTIAVGMIWPLGLLFAATATIVGCIIWVRRKYPRILNQN